MGSDCNKRLTVANATKKAGELRGYTAGLLDVLKVAATNQRDELSIW